MTEAAFEKASALPRCRTVAFDGRLLGLDGVPHGHAVRDELGVEQRGRRVGRVVGGLLLLLLGRLGGLGWLLGGGNDGLNLGLLLVIVARRGR